MFGHSAEIYGHGGEMFQGAAEHCGGIAVLVPLACAYIPVLTCCAGTKKCVGHSSAGTDARACCYHTPVLKFTGML
eukprot:881797-Rhodomonas_salina.1